MEAALFRMTDSGVVEGYIGSALGRVVLFLVNHATLQEKPSPLTPRKGWSSEEGKKVPRTGFVCQWLLSGPQNRSNSLKNAISQISKLYRRVSKDMFG